MSKPVHFLGSSLDDLRSFPQEARRTAGFQLNKVQDGEQPDDWKSMSVVGAGVIEIRIRDSSGIYRLLYVARFSVAVYVLHAFRKTSQKTAKADLTLAQSRYQELLKTRQ